jgi:hypothetical protein
MTQIIVVTGLNQLPPAERWPRVIAPLAEKLAGSGLGALSDLAALRRDADHQGLRETTEVVVALNHFGYGRQLVDRVVEEAGLQCDRPVLPQRWREFNCADYFASALAAHGHWDELGQYWYIEPAQQIYEDPDRQFLVIGGPGVDGILWGYRHGQSGVWAHPIDGEFVWLAPTAEALLRGWLTGTITVYR